MWIRLINSAKSNKKITKNKKILKKTNPSVKKLTKTQKNDIFNKNTHKYINKNKKAPQSQNKSVSKRFKIKPTGEWPHQDESLPTFEDLLQQGYNRVTFVAHPNACKFCKRKNGKTWSLSNFIKGLNYEAPIFERSHVNAMSKMKVWDINGELEEVYVDYTGEIF